MNRKLKPIVVTVWCLAAAALMSCASGAAPGKPAATGSAQPQTGVDSTSVTRPMLAAAQIDPTTQPALPPGHPDVSQSDSPMNQPAASSGSLPAGHPDISQMIKRSTSAGGSAGSAMPAGSNLPAGHPDISALQRQSRSATTQPTVSLTGVLSVRAIQGSAGGPAIGADPLVVEFYARGELIDKYEGKLDEAGCAVVNGIPLNLNPQPVVKVTHAGVEYTAVGEPMQSGSPRAEIQVPVYETTDQPPQWTVRMRHVMVSRGERGLEVLEMLAIDNPSDRTWLGTPIGEGQRATFTLSLPPGAQDIQMLGAHGCCAKIEGNRLTNTMPLLPGTSQHQIAYVLPAENGTAEITVDSPVPLKHLMVFIPDDGTTVTPVGIEFTGSADMGRGGKTRFYKAANLQPQQQVKLTISGISIARAAGGATAASNASRAAKIVAGAGAAVIILFGVALLFIRTAPRKA
ncbi:hypothetical protein [Fontivita pretiosa]|uniref:hypothetical protein n=1 Tax=Fontivita pretiosa TaxID=2989684 RepID=UPI003D17B9DC